MEQLEESPNDGIFQFSKVNALAQAVKKHFLMPIMFQMPISSGGFCVCMTLLQVVLFIINPLHLFTK